MKKILVLLAAAAIVFAMSVSSFAAFTDMPAGIDGEVLQKAVDNGLIQGFEDGTVQPGTPITRAQMAAIMSRALRASKKADISSFADVTEGEWYYEEMAKAVYMSAFKGDTLNRLNPNAKISRQEAFIVLFRIFDLAECDTNVIYEFTDGNQVAVWAKTETAAVVGAGYLGEETAIRPAEAMTRLEFAKIMDKIVSAYIDEDGEYTTLPEGNVLVRAKNVSFKDVKKTGNLYLGDGIEGIVNFNDCEIERMVVRNKQIAVNSGTYTWIRGIGQGTEIYLMKSPVDLVKKFEDGTTGKFYAAPGKAVLIPLLSAIEVDAE